MRISVESDFNQAFRELDETPKRLARAGVTAVNRTVVTVRKEARTAVAEKVEPRVKRTTNEAIDMKRATIATRAATITINERYLGLEKVKRVKVVSFRKGRRRVQKVSYRGRVLKGAFRPKNLTKGDKAIFKQVDGRYATGNRKVQRVYAYSILQETDKAAILERLEPIARDRFRIEFSRALAFGR